MSLSFGEGLIFCWLKSVSFWSIHEYCTEKVSIIVSFPFQCYLTEAPPSKSPTLDF